MVTPRPEVALPITGVFPKTAPSEQPFLTMQWNKPVSYFVGRNGSGKSRTAKALARATGALYLSTDRLLGIMKVDSNPYGSSVSPAKGISLEEENRDYFDQQSREQGMATEQLMFLRKEPEIALRVAAFIRRALGRVIELRETAGFLDPFVRLGDVEYSLIRDEGHGLRELVVLLAALYREDWEVLIVDEPELHLHPALARLWITEVEAVCRASDRNAVVVTHEPSLVRPQSGEDLDAIWLFSPGKAPTTVRSAVPEALLSRVTASLKMNVGLVSQLVFSPRPVLVEGPHDVAAFSTAVARTQDPVVVAQTEFVQCGSSNAVAMWFVIAKSLHLDVLAIADLDAVFNGDVQRLIDASPRLQASYRDTLLSEPPATHVALRPLIEAANAAKVRKDEKSRARWLADLDDQAGALLTRRDKLIEIWREEGLWLHPQGTLEDVLGIEKGKAEPASAAETPGAVDVVASWCAYELDTEGDLRLLLASAVERIANNINHAQGASPGVDFSAPVGPSSTADSKIADIESLGSGRYRLTVIAPSEFTGQWLEFDRSTAVDSMQLRTPE
jgi:hypothetical protein